MQLDADRLIEACREDSQDAGISITTRLEPLAGPGAKVKPAVYAGGQFQLGKRWWGEGDDRKVVDVIVIDNEPSQANRLEAALLAMRDELGLPEIVLDLSDLEPLPPHVPRQLSSFVFPHRNADAYLRDSELDGTPFLRTPVGEAIFAATADNADALVEWFPQSLLFGFWQSHLGKKGSQAKLARNWVSEIVGIQPAANDVRTLGLKGDPLNLSVEDPVSYDERWHENWDFGQKGKKLSDIGHGQVPVTGEDAALSGVSFSEIVQQSTVSFAGLRRVRTSVGAPEARALAVAVGLVAHAGAFGRGFHLRSGCDLRPVETTWKWIGVDGVSDLEPVSLGEAKALVRDVAQRAEASGLPTGTRWPSPLTLQPKKNLADAIRKTFPVADES
ncbi:MAG: type I-U CRISPR-associated RAMP protein Csb1/Cas7u [Acidimicrobiales bacterium]|nr:type I-U CRISPR-associated RAMP protein Csb1/Cas7u [Acidimicrobiales bacterium]